MEPYGPSLCILQLLDNVLVAKRYLFGMRGAKLWVSIAKLSEQRSEIIHIILLRSSVSFALYVLFHVLTRSFISSTFAS
jgi:hypothetical protein